MKSGLTTILTLTTAIWSWGQIVKLETSNPAPRVGDPITISFTINKNDPDSLEIADDLIAKMFVSSMNHVGDGQIEFGEWAFTEVGPLKIGPLQIPINSKVYTTTTLNMTVSPKLPSEINEGIWIRILSSDGVNYIILEQRQPGKWAPRTDSNGRQTYGMKMSTGDAIWTELDMDKIKKKGIEIKRKGARSSIQSVDTGSALYMVTVYTYKTPDSFKGQFTIGKDLLIYLPDNGHFEVERVKN